MGFKTGQKRPANAGRKKATPNKNSLVLREQLEALGVSLPAEIQECLAVLEDLKEQCIQRGTTKRPASLWFQMEVTKLKMDTFVNMMRYAYPTLKAIEQTTTEKTDELKPDIVYVSQWGNNSEPTDGNG